MKKSVLFVFVILLIVLACAITGCTPLGGQVVENPDTILNGVKQISLSEYKTEYWLGQELNLSGAILKVLLETGEVKNIDANNRKVVSVTGYNRFQSGLQNVIIKYGGKVSATFTVNVKVPEINEISLKSYPTKLDYVEGDRIDVTGAIITVLMEDTTAIDFAVDNSIVSSAVLNKDKEFTVTGTNLEVNISYGIKRITFYVNVSPKVLTSIKIAQWPARQNYYKNDTVFDPAGLKLVYTYNNGKTQIVDAEAQSALEYDYDFTIANAQSPVTVRYAEAGETLFSATFTVIVNDKSYQSLTIITRPSGVDTLIEGFSEIDYSTGIAEITFDDGSTERFAMNHPAITKSDYNNKKIGTQEITVYYYNNTLNSAKLSVNTRAKQAVRVDLVGTQDISDVVYFEGQSTNISIAKLYFIVRYDNGTSGIETAVSEAMLANGTNLTSTANGGQGGIKRLDFLIAGIVVGFDIEITPAAVERIQIDTLPQNLFVSIGGVPMVGGGIIKVTYNNQNNQKLAMDSVDVTVVCDTTSSSVGDIATVKVYLGTPSDSAPCAVYDVKVVEKSVKSVQLITQPSKKDNYKYGETVRFSGMVFTVTYGDDTLETLTATADVVKDGIPTVRFSSDTGREVFVASAILAENGKTELTESQDIYAYFYGVRATPSFRVSVEERSVNGLSILSTEDVKMNMIVGNDYSSVAGISVKISYTDNSSDYVEFLANTATRITEQTVPTTAGFFWYTTGSMSEAGEVVVTVIYSFKNKLGQISTYPDSYTVLYDVAKLVRLTGVFTLEGGLYLDSETLGTQPKGLSPYLQNYYLGCYYEGDVTKYIPLSVTMTDYDTKNLTSGIRNVAIRYSGFDWNTKINVADAAITGISIGKLPRVNYVFTESLSLVGGTLIRTFLVEGAQKQDTVDMKEAERSLLNKWPTSVADFNGAPKLVITVQLKYQNVQPVSFNVDVYQPITLVPSVANTQNYYGNVSDPAVSLGTPITNFTLPTYTVRYEDDNGADISEGSTPVVDRNGNISYPTPKSVGNYRVVVLSAGNRYYSALEEREEFIISPLAITLRPNFVAKTYGKDDPTYTFTSSNDKLWKEAQYDGVGNPLGKGAFTRALGEDVGTYAITEDGNNRFEHPYFVISVEVAGTLSITPSLIELQTNPSVLYYKKNQDGSVVDQRGILTYLFSFVTLSTEGVKTVVTEAEVLANIGNPNYKIYEEYLKELKPEEGFTMNYLWELFVRDADGTYSSELPIAAKGDYSIKITISAIEGKTLNFKFFNKDTSGGTLETLLGIRVEAEPWQAPVVGGNALILATEVTDIAELEVLVTAQEELYQTHYDLVSTNNFVYIWKYRNTAAQQDQYPEGRYLAYSTNLLGSAFIAEDTVSKGAGGFRVSKEHLQKVGDGAFIELKFVSNNDDRADSTAVSLWMPNIF